MSYYARTFFALTTVPWPCVKFILSRMLSHPTLLFWLFFFAFRFFLTYTPGCIISDRRLLFFICLSEFSIFVRSFFFRPFLHETKSPASIKKIAQFQQICADLCRYAQICADLYVAELRAFLPSMRYIYEVV